MAEIISVEPIAVASDPVDATKSQTREYLVYYVFGILEILLLFRLILKLTGASLQSYFVNIVYKLTNIFIVPFNGIFKREYADGSGSTFVFEPAALVALFVYMALAWGIVKLIRISSGEKQIN